MNYNHHHHHLGSGGVEDTTYKIDKYFRRIETIEMNLSERGSETVLCAPPSSARHRWIIPSFF